MSVAELRFGIELLTQGDARRDELNEWLASDIRPMFGGAGKPITPIRSRTC